MKILKKMTLIIVIVSMLFSCVPVGVSAERGPDYDRDVELGEVAINMLNRRANHRAGGQRYANSRLGDLNEARMRGGEVREKTLADIGSRIRIHLENVGTNTEEYVDTAVYKIGPELKDAVALIFSNMFSKKDEALEEVIYEKKGYDGFRYLGKLDNVSSMYSQNIHFNMDPDPKSPHQMQMEEILEFDRPSELVLVFDLVTSNLPLEHLSRFSYESTYRHGLYSPHGVYSHVPEIVEYEQLSDSSFVIQFDFSKDIPLSNFPFELQRFNFTVREGRTLAKEFLPEDSHYEVYYKLIDAKSKRPEIVGHHTFGIYNFIHDDYKEVLTSGDSLEDIYYTINQYLNEEYPDDLLLDHSKDEDGYSPGSFEDYNVPSYQMPTFERKDERGLLDRWFDNWFSKDKEKEENDMSKDSINSFAENILPDGFPNMQLALSELENVEVEAPVIHLNVYSLLDESTKHISPELSSMLPFDDEDTEIFDFASLDRFEFGGVSLVSYVRMIIGFGFIFITFRHLWNSIMEIL